MALVQRAKINFLEAHLITFVNALPVFRCKSSPLEADCGLSAAAGAIPSASHALFSSVNSRYFFLSMHA